MNRHQPPDGSSAIQTAAFARFDGEDQLVEASGEFRDMVSMIPGLVSRDAVLGAYLEQFETIDGCDVSSVDGGHNSFLETWCGPEGHALEARGEDGRWRLLSRSSCPGGDTLYVTTSIDRQKQHRDLAHCITESLPLPVWAASVETGEVLYSNAATNQLYGVRPNNQDGRYAKEFFPDRDDSIALLRTLQAKGSIQNYPVRTRTESGREVLVNICGTVTDYQGRPVTVAAVQDLTDRQELEEDTLKARDMLRDAIEALSEGFALYGEDGRLVMCNSRYREMNQSVADLLEPGLDWEILMRETARRGVYAEAIGREDEWVSERLENGIEYIQDYELQHTDGTHYLVSVHPTKLGGFVVTRTDVTDRKLAEAAERDGDLLIRQVLEASPAAVTMTRVGDGQILYRSPAALELFGKVKNAAEIYLSIDDRADYITALLVDGRIDDFKLTLINGDSEPFPASLHGRLAEFKGEEVIVTTTIDLTRQNEAEAMIRQVLEACPVPVQMTNADTGALLFRSPETVALFGAPDTSTSYYVDPNDRSRYVDKLRETGWINEHKARFRNAKGAEFWGSVSARLIDFRGQQVIVSNTRDLTEELALQEELASQREMLFQNEKMSALGELLAGVAHELNNPLSVVVGHSLMLREETQDPETIKRIEKIGGAAERCAKIVKTFLAMARQRPSRMEQTDINAVITTAVDVAGYGSESVRIDRQLSVDLPEIAADADQITQVIINLIINAEQAIMATGQGDRIVVTTDVNKSGTSIEIHVADNGPGIPPSIMPRIFEPFFTTKDVGDGTGIGLAFCHRIIHSHGGRIWVDPEYREGSRFGISLPISNVEAQDESDPLDAGRRRIDTRVLVVDDEADVAELISEILKKEGFQVDVAHSGTEALEALARARYDLLLSDLNMPGLDGRGLYDMVRKDHPDLVERTAFITGDTMGHASQGLLQESRRPYLEKPVSPAELRELVYRLLNDKADE